MAIVEMPTYLYCLLFCFHFENRWRNLMDPFLFWTIDVFFKFLFWKNKIQKVHQKMKIKIFQNIQINTWATCVGPGSFGLLIMPNSVFAAIHIDMKIESFKCAKIFLNAFFNQFFRCTTSFRLYYHSPTHSISVCQDT